MQARRQSVIFSVGLASLSGWIIGMPRKPRVEFEGAVCHVMCRGDRREPIVQDDDVDRTEFLRCLEGCRWAERLRPLKAAQE